MDITPTVSTEKELDEFRAQWKQEVTSRHQQQQEQQQRQQVGESGYVPAKTAATRYDDVVRQAESLSLHQPSIEKGKSDFSNKQNATTTLGGETSNLWKQANTICNSNNKKRR
ncbi:unnamed protein product [Absidia cylindrospora]